MKIRRVTAVVATTLLTGSMCVASSFHAAAAGARHSAGVPSLIPASSGHVLSRTLDFPPDTAYCRANIGISCYQPAQYQKAYNLAPLFKQGDTGRGRTIAIVDAFGSPTIGADLATFDKTFNLPDPPHLRVIQPAGAVPDYPQDPFGAADRSGWAVETTLDVEYAHAMAPGADILLVETPQSETEGVQGLPEIVAAENYVIKHHLADVITQSFGATENTFPSRESIMQLRTAFYAATKNHVTVLASSGDDGSTDAKTDLTCCYTMPVNSWPSADPLVTSIGGTQLNLDAVGNRLSPDVVWNDGYGAGGGGLSQVFPRPAFQDSVRGTVGTRRGTPDISMSAAVDGAAVFYYSFCDYSRSDPTTGQPPLCGPQWHLVGGTSEASPLFSGIVALADQAAGRRLGYLNPKLYSLGVQGGAYSRRNGLVDVTSGNNAFYTYCTANCGSSNEVDTTVPGYAAKTGYDLASGLGTVDAVRFVKALAHR